MGSGGLTRSAFRRSAALRTAAQGASPTGRVAPRRLGGLRRFALPVGLRSCESNAVSARSVACHNWWGGPDGWRILLTADAQPPSSGGCGRNPANSSRSADVPVIINSGCFSACAAADCRRSETSLTLHHDYSEAAPSPVRLGFVPGGRRAGMSQHAHHPRELDLTARAAAGGARGAG